MGTRGLLGFIINGARRGSYNHWDSYPQGLGNAIVKFILSLNDEQIKTMAERVAALKWDDDEGQVKMAESLPLILDGTVTSMPDQSDFINNDLFCEWAYYMDFENKLLEIWAYGSHADTVKFAALTPKFMEEWEEEYDKRVGDDEDEDENNGENEEEDAEDQNGKDSN